MDIPDENIDRREAIRKTAALGLGGALLGPTSEANTGRTGKSRADLIRNENAKEGSDDWQLTRIRADKQGHRMPWIEGYCSRQSVKAGETIHFMVSTDPVRKFELEIFRTGYYGGKGARLVKKLGPFQGKVQQTPEPQAGNNLHECKWEASASIEIPDGWLSGVYLGRLTTLPATGDDPYWQSYVIFVVKDDRPADILFQCSDNTWQAYNRWPNNYSLYTHPDGDHAPSAHVSFDRPYGRQAQFTSVVNDPLSFGSGEFLSFEQPFAYFLEQHGYDVTYCCNCDMLTPGRALKCKSFLSVGHDEYWDTRQYHSLVKLRDEGVSLLFFSGNTSCWVSPFSSSSAGAPNRTIFRSGPYGNHRGADFLVKKNGPYPERGPDEGLLIGVRNVRPVNGGGDWTITNSKHWIFEGTGIKDGDRIRGLVGWEYLGDPPPIPGLEIIAEGTAWVGGDKPQRWCSTVYPGTKGNFVFSASTIFWAQGLSMPPGHTLPWSHWSRPHGPDARVQRITRNLLDRAIS